MPKGSSTDVRKTQSLGKSSIGVTIPKNWADAIGLGPGSPVYLELRDEGILIRPIAKETQRSSSIHVTTESSIDGILRMVISSYLRGDNFITIKFDKANSLTKDTLFSAIKSKLAGIELIEENPTEARVNILSVQTQLPLSKLMHRMWLTVRGMMRDSLDLIGSGDEALARDVTARDDEVDKTYLLIHRLINMAIEGRILLSSISLQNRIELTPYLLVAKSVERSGDHAWRIAQWAPHLNAPNHAVETVKNLGIRVLELGNEALTAFIGKNTDIAMKILDKRNILLNERVEAMEAMHEVTMDSRGYMLLVIESIGRIAAYAFDVAETTLDAYST
ncbi:MAG: PhoU domain-containing protein [Thermocladium sp.]